MISELTDSAFNGPGGRRVCVFKEEAGLQRSVMEAFFQSMGKEMPL